MTVGRLLAGLVAVAAALTPILLGRSPARGGAAPAPGARAAPVVVVTGAAPGRPSSPARRPPPTASPPPPGPATVSRRFVVAYAAFVYGRLAAADLPDLSPALRRQIDALHPRPAAAVLAAADPRLASLRLAPARPGRARALAVIADGPAVYAIALALRRRPSGWTITGLAETG